MICRLCAGTSTRLFEVHGYWIRNCTVCGHQFAELQDSAEHVSRVYGDEYFQGGHDGYSDYLSEAALLREHGRWYGRRLAAHTTPGKALDVGAAAGYFFQGLTDCGWRGTCVEPNTSMANHARDKLGLSVSNAALEQFRTDELYDLVCFVQVLPHLVEPRQCLEAAARVTRPHGFWLIETWDRSSLSARLLGKYWHEYSPPSVLHWFCRDSVRRLVAEFGLRQVDSGRPSKWLNGAHLKSLASYKLQGNRFGRAAAGLLGIIPDRLAIPYPSEDLFWALFEKSS